MISHPRGKIAFQIFSQLLILAAHLFSHLLLGGPDPEAYFDGAAQKSNRCEKWEVLDMANWIQRPQLKGQFYVENGPKDTAPQVEVQVVRNYKREG